MTPLTKKLIESGLLRQHAAQLLERWGTLPPGSADAARPDDADALTLTEEGLASFVDEIDEILAQVEKGKMEVVFD